ncbi:YdbC family protein [Alkalihalobacillus sp. R86527]|uniref:YdbC family protein n=1 Tax=Alkalihalobacillus sp. R86527 TaxID=3093863 RepID=UPI00366EE1A8
MLVKKIVCTVKDGREEVFSAGQEQWKALANCTGFIAQIGGWMQGRENVAMIAAAWEDLASYEEFMTNTHDGIYERTEQQGSIENIDVQLEEVVVREEDRALKDWLTSQNVSLEEKWSIVK